MAAPFGSRVFTGAAGEQSGYGKGAAYVPDSTKSLEILSKGLKDIRENERQKKLDAQKKANAWNSLLEDTPDVWQIDFEKVNEKSLAYTNHVISLKERGFDPYNLPPEEMRELNRLKTEVIREANAAKANKEYWDKNTMAINTDAGKKFDQGYATEFFKSYTDPSMSATERAKYRTENSPYLKNVDLIDIVDGIYDKMPLETAPVGKQIISTKDEEKFKSLFEIYLNSDSGQDDYEALMKRGDYTTEDELVEDAIKAFRAMNEKDVKDKPKESSGGTGSTKNKKPTVKVKSIDSDTKTDSGEPLYDQGLEFNKILLDNTPGVYVVDNDGNRIKDFIPSGGFRIRKDGNIDVIGEGKSEADNSVVEITINYEKNKDQFNVKGYPNMYNEFRKQGGASAGKSKSKEIKRSQISEKAKAAGYTDAEYEALLSKNGVKIIEGQ
jgi:hypothetical protein